MSDWKSRATPVTEATPVDSPKSDWKSRAEAVDLNDELHKAADDSMRQGSWAETSPIIQKLKAFGYGVSGGVPFSEQVAGLVGKLQGKDYDKSRDIFKANEELAQYQNPSEYMVGNVAGGIGAFAAPELAVAGKLGSGIQAASKAVGLGKYTELAEPVKQALVGATYGASKSPVDLTKGSDLTSDDILQYGKDIATPAAVMGGIGALPGAIAGTVNRTPLKDTSYGKLFNKAYNEGKDLSSKAVLEQTAKEKLALADNIVTDIVKSAKENAALKNKLVNETYAKSPVNLAEIRQFAEKQLDNLSPDIKENKELVAKIKQQLSEAFKDKEVAKQVTTSKLTKEVAAEPSMKQRLEEKIADQKLKDQALGINATYEIEPITNELGQKRLKVNRIVHETSSDIPEKVVAVKDADGKVIDYRLDKSTGSPGDDITASTSIHPDELGTPAHKVFSPEIQEVNEIVPHDPVYSLQEADQVRKNLSQILDKQKEKIGPFGNQNTLVSSPLEQTRGKLSEVINTSTPEISKINSSIRQRADIAEGLGLGKIAEEDLLSLKHQDLDSKLRQMANPVATTTEEAQNQLAKQTELRAKLNDFKPEVAEKFDKMKSLSEDLHAGDTVDSDMGQLAYHSGRIKEVAKQIAGKGGLALRAANKTVPYATTPATATFESPKFSEMSDEQKLMLIDKLKGKNVTAVSKKLEQAVASGNNLDKAQADFVMGQTPGAKKLITPDEEQ